MENYWDNYVFEEVLDIESGEIIPVDHFYSMEVEQQFKLRYELKNAVCESTKKIVCPICNEFLILRGGVNTGIKLHFSHVKDSPDCPIKTDLTIDELESARRKFHYVRESKAHKEMKLWLTEVMRNDSRFENVFAEKRISSYFLEKEYKRPDVQAEYLNKKYVFEIQLTTTFLSVIVERNEFYKKESINIIWLFKIFNPKSMVFTERDVIYQNKLNAFVFNDDIYQQSIKENRFLLIVYYPKYNIGKYNFGKSNILECIWEKKIIDFSQIKFENGCVYYFDSDKNKENILKQIEIENEKIRIENERRIQEIKNIENKIREQRERKRINIENKIREQERKNERYKEEFLWWLDTEISRLKRISNKNDKHEQELSIMIDNELIKLRREKFEYGINDEILSIKDKINKWKLIIIENGKREQERIERIEQERINLVLKRMEPCKHFNSQLRAYTEGKKSLVRQCTDCGAIVTDDIAELKPCDLLNRDLIPLFDVRKVNEYRYESNKRAGKLA